MSDEAEKLKKWLIQQLRRLSYMYPGSGRTKLLQRARVSYGKYKCAKCSGLFERQKIAVDHLRPVVDPVLGWQSYDEYISRLFCPPENLQILCKACHQKKSNAENSVRRSAKKRRKEAVTDGIDTDSN